MLCRSRTLKPLSLTLALYLLPACTSTNISGKLPLLDQVHDQLDHLALPIQLPERFALGRDSINIDATHFTECMVPLTAQLKPRFIDLIHNLQQKNDAANQHLFTGIQHLGDENLLLSEYELHPLINHIFDKLLNDIRLDKSSVDITGKLSVFNANFSKDFKDGTEILAQDTEQLSARAKAYLIAYFRKGVDQTLSQTLHDKQIKNQLAAILNRNNDDPVLTQALEAIDLQLLKFSVSIPNHNSGFIARDGSQYSFPGLEIQAGRIAVDHSQIGADVIRILFEALRDTYAPLPVVANATALTVETTNLKKRNYKQNYELTFLDNTANITWSFDRRHPDQLANISLDQMQFQTMEAQAREAEAFVAGNVGRVIRGGSWGALNNEAVAKLVETLAGVVARQVTERAQWCAHA